MATFLPRLIGFIWLMATVQAAAQIVIPDSLQQEGKTVRGNREGTWKFYTPSGKLLQAEGSYRNGKPEGKWFWYAANRIFFEQNYRKGLPEGWGKWYAEGELVREQWFRKGVADSVFAYYNRAGHYALRGMTDKSRPRGMWQVYFPDGKLAAEWHWFKQGAYQGTSQWFYPNGRLFAKGHFITGLAEGRWEFHTPDDTQLITGNFKDDVPHDIWEISERGKRVNRMLFKDGKINGQQLNYDAEGQVLEKITYNNGQLVRLETKDKVLIDSGAGERIFRDWQGNIVAKGIYSNGWLEGNMQYFTDLQEVVILAYRKGQPEGAFEWHTAKGELLMRGIYRSGALDSLCLFFYPNGKVKAQGMFLAGRETGIWQFFHPNGNLQAAGEYQNGIPEGKWTYYDEEGHMTATGLLHGGCTVGEWTFYDKGRMVAKGYWEDGLKSGMWTDYYPNGKIRATGSYVHNREQGEWRYFHSNGALRQTEQWEAGKLLEISDFMGVNGRLLPKGTFKRGNGSRLIYHEKRRGTVSISGYYKDGLPDGRWRYYDRKGRLQKERIFVQGKPQSDD